jgi:hypothetical protein
VLVLPGVPVVEVTAGENVLERMRPAVVLEVAAGAVAAVVAGPVADVAAADGLAAMAWCSCPPSGTSPSTAVASRISADLGRWVHRGMTGAMGGGSATATSAAERMVHTAPGRRIVDGVRIAGRGCGSGSVRDQEMMVRAASRARAGAYTVACGGGGSSPARVELMSAMPGWRASRCASTVTAGGGSGLAGGAPSRRSRSDTATADQ